MDCTISCTMYNNRTSNESDSNGNIAQLSLALNGNKAIVNPSSKSTRNVTRSRVVSSSSFPSNRLSNSLIAAGRSTVSLSVPKPRNSTKSTTRASTSPSPARSTASNSSSSSSRSVSAHSQSRLESQLNISNGINKDDSTDDDQDEPITPNDPFTPLIVDTDADDVGSDQNCDPNSDINSDDEPVSDDDIPNTSNTDSKQLEQLTDVLNSMSMSNVTSIKSGEQLSILSQSGIKETFLKPTLFEEKQESNIASSSASAASANTQPTSITVNGVVYSKGDGKRRPVFLCPSLFAHRPPTIYFDYPISFAQSRQQYEQIYHSQINDEYTLSSSCSNKTLEDRQCNLRYLIGDEAQCYNSITGTLRRAGFVECNNVEQDNFHIRWGKHLSFPLLQQLKSYQYINHFPGSGGIGRKDRLCRNYQKLKRAITNTSQLHNDNIFDFLPETYLLPYDRSIFESRFHQLNQDQISANLWILKPNSSSCGRGIKLINKISEINFQKKQIISRYISNPFLIKNHKFDLRIYVLVTSFDPLRIYIYDNGLVRFCTEKYNLSNKSLKKRFCHLTNYSVNKRSKHFIKNDNKQDNDNDNQGSKWSLIAFKQYLQQILNIDTNKLFEQIHLLILKTLCSIESHIVSNLYNLKLTNNSNSSSSSFPHCFELFGFDVLIDENFKCWLMEVNCGPSLSSSSALDKKIKNQLMTDIFHLIGIKPTYQPIEKKKKLKKNNSSNTQQITQIINKNDKTKKNDKNDKLDKNDKFSTNPNDKSFRKAKNNSTVDSSENFTESSQRNITKLKSTKLINYPLSKQQIDILRDLEDEYQRRGHFQRIFPNLQLWEKIEICFEKERFNNYLMIKFLQCDKQQRMKIVKYKSK